MVVKNLINILFLWALIGPGFISGCSDQQEMEEPLEQGQQEDENQDQEDEQGQEDGDMEEEGEDIEDNMGEEEAGDDSSNVLENAYQNAQEGEGEAINNSTENEFQANQDIAELPATDNAVADPIAEQAAAEPTEPAPSEGARVMYAIQETGVFSAADGANQIESMQQGDHPLIFAEGEWSRTSDGKYVNSSSLTQKPVGRIKPAATWQ